MQRFELDLKRKGKKKRNRGEVKKSKSKTVEREDGGLFIIEITVDPNHFDYYLTK